MRCEGRAWSPQLVRLAVRAAGRRGLGERVCDGCGAVLPVGLVTERLLGKLVQLDRFGLGGGAKPLLGRADEGA
jgi:hypothetical protein